MSFTLGESKDFQSHSVRLGYTPAGKGVKDLSLSPAMRIECLHSSGGVAISPMGGAHFDVPCFSRKGKAYSTHQNPLRDGH